MDEDNTPTYAGIFAGLGLVLSKMAKTAQERAEHSRSDKRGLTLFDLKFIFQAGATECLRLLTESEKG